MVEKDCTKGDHLLCILFSEGLLVSKFIELMISNRKLTLKRCFRDPNEIFYGSAGLVSEKQTNRKLQLGGQVYNSYQ